MWTFYILLNEWQSEWICQKPILQCLYTFIILQAKRAINSPKDINELWIVTNGATRYVDVSFRPPQSFQFWWVNCIDSILRQTSSVWRQKDLTAYWYDWLLDPFASQLANYLRSPLPELWAINDILKGSKTTCWDFFPGLENRQKKHMTVHNVVHC